MDYGNGGAAVGGGIVADIVGIVAYTAADCMTGCAVFNKAQDIWGNNTRCAGVTFARKISLTYDDLAANCWLKNGTAVNPATVDTELSAAVIFS